MGEDRVCNGEVLLQPRQRTSSAMSSCSEDSEATSGFQSSSTLEEELEYGPGIVSKLKTRFLTISLKQTRGGMRRSCSMENLLDLQDKSSRTSSMLSCESSSCGKDAAQMDKNRWGHLKRAKSMDTLLLELQPEPPPTPTPQEVGAGPKIVRRRDGGILRTVPTLCDEELPKPDTVKTYKRMFEPAESRRGSCCRRPPVLRASAKTVSKTGSCLQQGAKMNGTFSKCKSSAKPVVESPTPRAQPEKVPSEASVTQPPEVVVKGLEQPVVNGGVAKPVCNGQLAKAVPAKVIDNRLCNGSADRVAEKTIKPVKLTLTDTEMKLNGNNCNGDSSIKELMRREVIEECKKPEGKKPVSKVLNGTESPTGNNAVNGIKTKPKVPPNRPVFVKNAKFANGMERGNLIPKLKPVAKKPDDVRKPDTPPRIENLAPDKALTNGEPKTDSKIAKPVEIKSDKKIVEQNNLKNLDNSPAKPVKPNDFPPTSPKVSEKLVNGDVANGLKDCPENSPKVAAAASPDSKLTKKSSADPLTTSMVFDFRGKDVVPHVAVMPTPFGCKALHPKKKPLLVDGIDGILNERGVTSEDDDEFHMDFSVPAPSGVVFEGENVKIGKGSILSTRNKELKIQFEANVGDNTFVYPSETSLLEDGEQSSLSPSSSPPPPVQSAPSKLMSNPAIGSTGEGGLSTYTPSVLRTMDNFEPGMFRPPPASTHPEKGDGGEPPGEDEENTEVDSPDGDELLKPADPSHISSWSLSAGTSDLLF